MNFQIKLNKNELRKAVAPIIATLLMVAISVVGGILIFVFAQGFFQDTSIQSPTLDAIEIFGYNANDTGGTGFFTHSGQDIKTIGGAISQSLKTADPFALYIRNTGSTTVAIEEVKVYGVKFGFDTDASGVASATVPDDKEFALLQNIAAGYIGVNLIEPGQELTLIMRYDAEDVNGEIKIGRPILIKIKTGQGNVFVKQIRNGVESG